MEKINENKSTTIDEEGIEDLSAKEEWKFERDRQSEGREISRLELYGG